MLTIICLVASTLLMTAVCCRAYTVSELLARLAVLVSLLLTQVATIAWVVSNWQTFEHLWYLLPLALPAGVFVFSLTLMVGILIGIPLDVLQGAVTKRLRSEKDVG